MNTIMAYIDPPSLNLLVSLYFGTDDRAWYYEKRGNYDDWVQPGVLYRLQRRGLVDIVDRTKQNILNRGSCRVKFGVTAAGESVIKAIFWADPDRIVEASQSYLRWVPVGVTDVLRHVVNGLRSDISQLPELLVSEAPIISETASLLLGWLQDGQVVELADMTSSNLVGKP